MGKSTRIPKLKVYPGADGRWRWTLVAGNGEIQCPSEGYASKHGATSGALALKRNAAIAVLEVVDKAPSKR